MKMWMIKLRCIRRTTRRWEEYGEVYLILGYNTTLQQLLLLLSLLLFRFEIRSFSNVRGVLSKCWNAMQTNGVFK